MLLERDAGMLEATGVAIPRFDDGSPNCVVELSPRSFFDVDDLKEHIIESGGAPSIRPEEEFYYE